MKKTIEMKKVASVNEAIEIINRLNYRNDTFEYHGYTREDNADIKYRHFDGYKENGEPDGFSLIEIVVGGKLEVVRFFNHFRNITVDIKLGDFNPDYSRYDQVIDADAQIENNAEVKAEVKTTIEMKIAKFEEGKTYYRIWNEDTGRPHMSHFTITKRTAKTVVLKNGYRCRIFINDNGVEVFKAGYDTYVYADNLCTVEAEKRQANSDDAWNKMEADAQRRMLELKAAEAERYEIMSTPLTTEDALEVAVNAEIKNANNAKINDLKREIRYTEGSIVDLDKNHIAHAPNDESLKERRTELVNELDNLNAQLAELLPTEPNTNSEYKYYLQSRRPIAGAVPNGYISATAGEMKVHSLRSDGSISPVPRKVVFGVVVYDHPLSDEQIINYDLHVDPRNPKAEPIPEVDEPKFQTDKSYYIKCDNGFGIEYYTLKVESRTDKMLTGTTPHGTCKYHIHDTFRGEYIRTHIYDDCGNREMIWAANELKDPIIQERDTARNEYCELNEIRKVIEKDCERYERLRDRCKAGSPKFKEYNQLLESFDPIIRAFGQKFIAAQDRYNKSLTLRTDEEKAATQKAIDTHNAALDARGIKYFATVRYYPHGHEGEDMETFCKECTSLDEANAFVSQEDIDGVYVGGIYDAGWEITDRNHNLIADHITGIKEEKTNREKLLALRQDYIITDNLSKNDSRMWYVNGKRSSQVKVWNLLQSYGLTLAEFLAEEEAYINECIAASCKQIAIKDQADFLYDKIKRDAQPSGDNIFDLLPTLDELNDFSETDPYLMDDDAEYTDRDARFNYGERYAAALTEKLRQYDPTVEVTYDIDYDDEDVYYLKFDGIYRSPYTLSGIESAFHRLKKDIAEEEFMKSIDGTLDDKIAALKRKQARDSINRAIKQCIRNRIGYLKSHNSKMEKYEYELLCLLQGARRELEVA